MLILVLIFYSDVIIAIDLVQALCVNFRGVGKPIIIPVQQAVVLFRFVSFLEFQKKTAVTFRVYSVVIFVARH